MKNNIRTSAFFLCCLTLSWMACTKGGPLASSTADVYLLTGKADSKQLVPAFDTTATGNFNGWYDSQVKGITANISWDKLWLDTKKDTIVSIRIYGPAAIGSNGALIKDVPLTNTNGSTGNVTLGFSGSTGLSTESINNMLGGKCYYTICTIRYPNGMVRGQINAIKSDPNVPVKNLVNRIDFPLTNKTLLAIGDTSTLQAIVLPYYATNKEIEWKSLNPAVASIGATGKVTGITKGITSITATAKDGSNVVGTTFVAVNYTLVQLATTGWTVTCSSEKVSDGGGKDMILDGNIATYWHSLWSPDAPLPHWLLVDMKLDYDISTIKVVRRNANTDTKTVIVQTSMDGVSFETVGTINFGTDNAGVANFFPRKAHYYKLTVTESNRAPFANIADVYVSGYQ